VNAVMNFWLHKMLGNYQVATWLVALRGVLSSIELVLVSVLNYLVHPFQYHAWWITSLGRNMCLCKNSITNWRSSVWNKIEHWKSLVVNWVYHSLK
jgi:hypothetical protein